MYFTESSTDWSEFRKVEVHGVLDIAEMSPPSEVFGIPFLIKNTSLDTFA